MILSNVNIGTGPSAGDGDPLRSAFSTINTNFQTITNNINALTNSVTSVAGRTGNVVLTVNDIIGWSSIVTQANINATVNTANIGMLGYIDSKITANIAALINSAPGALDTLQELASALGNNSSFASTITNSLATTNSNLIVANTSMRGYVDGQILAANSGISSSVTSANTSMRGYVDGQILAANSGISSSVTSANLGMKGYVDQANTIQSAQITAANLAIITANIGMKGYVDQANTIQSAQITAANVGIIGYIDQANTIQSAQIAAANVGIIGYIDQANTIQSAQIAAANVGMKGYVDAVTDAWTANAQAQQSLLANLGAVDLTTITATLGVHNGQINDLIANAGVQASSITDLYANAAAQAILISSLGNTAQIQSNIAALQSNAATQSDLIIRINSNVTQANLGMIGYVTSTVVTANVGMKGYVDSQVISINTGANANIASANLGMKGYVDSINSILTANAVSQGANINLLLSSVGSLPGQIIAANVGMKGYVDNAVATGGTYSNVNTLAYLTTNSYATQNYVNLANTSMKSYVDGQITAANTSGNTSQLWNNGYTLSVASLNGNVTLPGGAKIGTITGATEIKPASGQVVQLRSDNNFNRIQANDDNISIYGGDSQWKFDYLGKLTLPSGANITAYVDGITTIRDGEGVEIDLNVNNGFSTTLANGTRVLANAHVWTFGLSGNLTFPDNTVQTTAYVSSVNTAAISANVLTLDFNLSTQLVSHTANISNVSIAHGPGNLTSKSMTVILTQDATGGRTISGYYKTQDGLGLDIDTTALAVNIYTFLAVNDGSNTNLYAFSNGTNFI